MAFHVAVNSYANLKQEGRDDPEIAHLYLPGAGPVLIQGLLFEQTW
jgi:hypothetical protein